MNVAAFICALAAMAGPMPQAGQDSPPPQAAPAVVVAVAPIVNSVSPRFARADKDAFKAATNSAVEDWLAKAIEKTGHASSPRMAVQQAVAKLKLDFESAKQRTSANLSILGKELNADFVIFVWITKGSQENAKVGAMLSGLEKPHSVSKAEARVWFVEVGKEAPLVDGSKKVFSGEAKGPYFGTTEKGEITGSPEDVAVMLRVESKRRGEWIGRAASDAVREALDSAAQNTR